MNVDSIKAWLTQLFQDERGAASIKPVIALMGALFIFVTMTLNSFSHEEFAPSAELVQAAMVITAIGMGADTLDKFSPKDDKKKNG